MDFTLPPEIEDLRLRVRAFIEKHVLPLEADPANFSEHENIPQKRGWRRCARRRRRPACGRRSRRRNTAAWSCPSSPGRRSTRRPRASLFGPLAINCMAPDDGNMNLLRLVGTREQKDKWLKPIVDGKVRSSFVMTEPAPGSGSDPSMMLTARREEGRQIRHQGAQMVHHRRRRRCAFHPDGAHLRRQAARAHRVSLSQGPARLAHRAAHPDPRAGGARRPLRIGIRRARNAGRKHADRRGRRAESDADPARPGAAHALHALDRLGQTLHSRSRRLTSTSAKASASSSATAKACRSNWAKWRSRSRSAGCSPCTPPGCSIRAAARARKSRWPRCMSPTRCTRRPTSPSSCRARAASPRTRRWNGSIARRARRGWSTAPREVHMMVLARFMREEGRDFWQWGPGEGRKNER